jgi:hypothetical protein
MIRLATPIRFLDYADGYPISGDDLARQRPTPDPMECPGCRKPGFECSGAPVERCPNRHGFQRITSFLSSPGFCAGRVHVTNLQCGCQVVDDQSYLEA